MNRGVSERPGTWTLVGWMLAGLILPAIAFGLDLSMRVDPIIWGSGAWMSPAASGNAAGLRQFGVYALALLSMIGLLVHALTDPSNRYASWLALPLLIVGVCLAGAHALVFLPLLPLSLVGLLCGGLGLLGLAPYLALYVYVRVLRQALGRRLVLDGGSLAPACLASLLAAAPLAGAAWPAMSVQAAIDSMEGGGPAEVSAGFRRMGRLAAWAERDLVLAYPRLDAAAQVRMRNLFLERFGHDINERVRGERRVQFR